MGNKRSRPIWRDGRGKRPHRQPERPRAEADGEWGCLPSHWREETPAVLWEGLCDAEAAHSPQQNHLRVPDDFPQRLKRFKEESGLSWAEIAPPPGDLSLHH